MVIFNNNQVFANAQFDYMEFDTGMDLSTIEDEAELIEEAEDNSSESPKLNISKEWLVAYNSRKVIDRNAAEADIKATNSFSNALRGMLGLNLRAKDLNLDSDVWLPRMSVEDAMKAVGFGDAQVGCNKNGAVEAEPTKTDFSNLVSYLDETWSDSE